jgi:hypothetical protein
MRYFFFLFLALVIPGNCLRAQADSECPPHGPDSSTGSVIGRVVAAEGQVPLRFVRLRLSGPDGLEVREAESGSGGGFSFCQVPFGSLELTGQIGQLGGRIASISLPPGETVRVTLELAEASQGEFTGTLTGVVIDEGTRTPLEGAAVALPRFGQIAITNEFGRFTFASLPPGDFEVRVTLIGFRTTSGSVEIQIDKSVHTKVLLSTEPIALDPIEVTAVRRRFLLPGQEGLERRLNSGFGAFVLENEIERLMPLKLTQVLTQAGVQVVGGGQAVFMRRTSCGPTVYIDDVRVTHGATGISILGSGNHNLDRDSEAFPDRESPAEEAATAINMVQPMDVAAVEIYRGPAETPGQYLDSNSKCGVILIWTKRADIWGG